MFSDFGEKLNAQSGILSLMKDLGEKPSGIKTYALGGGNPYQIPEVEKLYRREMQNILSDGRTFENLVGCYDGPQGNNAFINAVVNCMNKNFNWKISAKNVCIANGSQSACFYLFNLLAGTSTENNSKTKKTILFPLVPEYVGYADQGIEKDMFASIPSLFEEYEDHTFKYFVDLSALRNYLKHHPEVAAMCVSRPTNPTGNVLTNAEIEEMSKLAREYKIPLIIDNAYGLPWPHIIFNDEAKLVWNENIILSMSLSKIGLPSARCGIIIAKEEIVSALSNLNSIIALASGNLGQALAKNLIESGELIKISNDVVMPFYKAQNLKAQKFIHKYFAGGDYAIHKGEGSIFLWVLMKDLQITSKEFYKKLKERGVVIVSGEYFFFGSDTENLKNHPHYDKCIRINYAREDQELEEGIKIIAEVYHQYRK